MCIVFITSVRRCFPACNSQIRQEEEQSLGFLDTLKENITRLNEPFLASAEMRLPCSAWPQHGHDELHMCRHACAAGSGWICWICWICRGDYILLHMSPLAVIHFNKALNADIMLMKVETLGWRSWTHGADPTSRWETLLIWGLSQYEQGSPRTFKQRSGVTFAFESDVISTHGTGTAIGISICPRWQTNKSTYSTATVPLSNNGVWPLVSVLQTATRGHLWHLGIDSSKTGTISVHYLKESTSLCNLPFVALWTMFNILKC